MSPSLAGLLGPVPGEVLALVLLASLLCPLRAIAEPASPWSPVDVAAAVDKLCKSRWDDYAMQRACERNQREATEKLKQPIMSLETSQAEMIRTGCAAKWPEDFSLRHACERNEIRRAGGTP